MLKRFPKGQGRGSGPGGKFRGTVTKSRLVNNMGEEVPEGQAEVPGSVSRLYYVLYEDGDAEELFAADVEHIVVPSVNDRAGPGAKRARGKGQGQANGWRSIDTAETTSHNASFSGATSPSSAASSPTGRLSTSPTPFSTLPSSFSSSSSSRRPVRANRGSWKEATTRKGGKLNSQTSHSSHNSHVTTHAAQLSFECSHSRHHITHLTLFPTLSSSQLKQKWSSMSPATPPLGRAHEESNDPYPDWAARRAAEVVVVVVVVVVVPT